MYEVLLHTRAQRAYRRLPARIVRQVNAALARQSSDPLTAPNVAPLHGDLRGLYRLRVGQYRIVFEVRRAQGQVFVLAIGPRGDVYK